MFGSPIPGRPLMSPIHASQSRSSCLLSILFGRVGELRRNPGNCRAGASPVVSALLNMRRSQTAATINAMKDRSLSPMEKTAQEIAARLRESGHIAYYAVGAHFGVILVVENGFQFEVATFRSDEAYIDGRRPSAVHFSTPEEDAKRRDFTINGMFYDPVSEEVIDFVGGCADIAARLLRAIGDPARRFAEDRLRMLRAVRLATVLDYQIDKQTWDALLANAASINEISAERIREELMRIFLSPSRTRGWDLLDSSGLMRAILREIEAMKGCKQPEQFHPEGDVFEHTRLMLQFLPEKVSVQLV